MSVLRPTVVTIDLAAIAHNYAMLQEQAGTAHVMCILKANAYGHGLIEIGRHLESIGAYYFGVAYLEEGIMLREAGISTPILVMGGIIGDQIPAFIEYDLTITASSIDKLLAIEAMAKKLQKKARVHLKIDTGMERIGIHYYSAEALIKASLTCKESIIEGIFSHFANADAVNLSYSHVQIGRFETVLGIYQSLGKKKPPLVHIANSAATIRLPSARYDMVRCGIMLYGIQPSTDIDLASKVTLHPALSWKTRVVYFKVVKKNHPVSYGSTWQANKMTRVITLPVGYGDGYFRAMSGRAQVQLHGKRYPVIGTICMDQLMVNISWDSSYNGDEVFLIGGSGDTKIKIEDLAKWAGTIPYEILTNINTRVPRVYSE